MTGPTWEIPELRWCTESGMVLRRADDGTWMVLDCVAECDDIAADTAARLLTVEEHCRRVERLMSARAGFDQTVRRRDRLLATAIGAVLIAVATAASRGA